jgi:hypothetical protein
LFLISFRLRQILVAISIIKEVPVTGRELLKLLPASAWIPALGAEVSFDRIDTHLHVHRTVAAVLRGHGEKRLARSFHLCRAVCRRQHLEPSGGSSGDGESCEKRATVEWPGRRRWTRVGFESADFASRAIADLNHWFREGAIAVKTWKIIGMAIRGRSGDYLMPDHPALLPVYEAIQKIRSNAGSSLG